MRATFPYNPISRNASRARTMAGTVGMPEWSSRISEEAPGTGEHTVYDYSVGARLGSEL